MRRLMSLVLVSPNEETEGKDEMMDILSLLFTSRGKPTGDTLLRLKNEYGIVLMKEESEEIEKIHVTGALGLGLEGEVAKELLPDGPLGYHVYLSHQIPVLVGDDVSIVPISAH